MIYGSVCSGIEAASVAWAPLCWRAAFLSEIDPFCRAVLAHRFPGTPLHGDFTTIAAGHYEPIELLVGGTPCQSFSVAGLRKGLGDDRGNLALEFLLLAGRLRPRWLVWENVPGVLSTDGGRAFGSIVGGMVELGYGLFWRILDAQHVRVDGLERAVPQRRRRVFVVGYLGDWRPAAAVFLEPESLRGDSPPRRTAGQDVAGRLAARAGGCGADDDAGRMIASTGAVARCLNAGGTGRLDYESETLVAHTLKGEGFDAGEDGTGRGTPLVPVAFDTTRCRPPAIAFNARQDPDAWAERTGPLDADGTTQAVARGWAVRRLTLRECERLQGFPDDWTLVPYRGRTAADGPRYRALGNSMAVNVMRWIGRRIALVEAILADTRSAA